MEYMLGAHLLGIPCGWRTAPGLVINVLSGPMPSPAGHVDVCGCRHPCQPSVHLMTARNFESLFAGRENKTHKKPSVIFLVLSHGHSGQSSCFDRSCVCLCVSGSEEMRQDWIYFLGAMSRRPTHVLFEPTFCASGRLFSQKATVLTFS